MGRILSNWRIMGAFLFAAALISGSYYFANVNSPSLAEASTETALLQAAASKDSTGDGLPDWQKVLYNIPLNATTTDYFHLGMTDGEAVARGLIVPSTVSTVQSPPTSAASQGTLTDAFSKAFFSLYLAAKQGNGGKDLSPDQTQSLANEAFTQFIENFTPSANVKNKEDQKIVGSSADELRIFADSAEAVFDQYAIKTPVNEFTAVRNVLQANDPDASARLSSLAAVYRKYAAGLAILPVPSSLAGANLDLVNAFYQRASIYDGIASAKNDPLLAIVSLQELSKNETAWAKAFADMGTVFSSADVAFGKDEPGAAFAALAREFASGRP